MNALRFAVIGQPIAHSKSPAMHGAAYLALGLPHAYERLATTESQLPERVAALRAGTYAGINVTVPHKTNVLAFVDEVDASARGAGAVNTLVRLSSGDIRAHNTDAPALVDELARLAGSRESFVGRSALVLGSGGAARAAIFALASLGVGHIIVRARRDHPELADIIATTATTVPTTLSFERLAASAPLLPERSDLVAIVQATTAGMEGSGTSGRLVVDAIAWPSVPRDCVVLDVVYAPPRTPLLERATAEGLTNDGGLGMLARQGALAFQLWLGVPAPFDVMRDALAKSLAR